MIEINSVYRQLEDKIYYIYIIKNRINDKVYIGQTCDLIKRMRSHKSYVNGKSKSKIHNAMRKHGIDNFYYEIIATCGDKNIINILEKQYIIIYNSIIGGYNITDGGDGVTSSVAKTLVTDKIRQSHSIRAKKLWADPEYRNKMMKIFRSMWTDEKKASQAIACAKTWDENRKQEYSERAKNQFWKDDEYIKKQSNAKKSHWADSKYREKMCAHSKKHSDDNPGFLASLAKKNWQDPELAKRMSCGSKQYKPVICLDTMIKYRSLNDAQRETGINRTCIAMQINGKISRAGGMRWAWDNIIKND